MTSFTKIDMVVELLSDEFEMIGEDMPLATNAAELNKHSLKDLDKVLDQIEIDPDWEARLRNIIEDSK